MIGWTFLGLFFFFLGWILWAPIRLEIDSDAGVFGLEWYGLCRVQWLPTEALDQLRLNVLFLQWPIRLGSSETTPPKPEKKPKVQQVKKPAGRKKMSLKQMFRLGRNLLGTFRVRRFHLVWDSDDFIWNARAYPVAQLLNSRGYGRIEINFMGRRELALILENRLGRLIWAALRTFITKQ